MAKRMLVDATHPEETRVAIVDGQRLDDLDFEVANRKMLKGNIYLAKVIRIEPSLQAAFVEYGGNRHGFLAFAEIHPDYYRIPIGDRPEGTEADVDDLADAPIITEGSGKPAPGDDDDEQGEAGETLAQSGNAGWSDEPGNGSLNDVIPGFALESHDSLVSDFTQPIEPMRASLADEQTESTVTGLDGDALPTADRSFEPFGGEAADVAPERFVRPRRPHYKIQEVIKRRQVMLIQVVKEERGNKGAALTTYLSLAGRYCVLMPNTAHGGGVSRKITNHQDRRRMKEILDQLDVPEGMALILRTAGMEQEISDIQRDLDYLLRLWNNVRERTLESSAPALIYEEANLIKRSLRDLYNRDISEIQVAGREGYDHARDFMQMMVPDAVDKIRLYEDNNIPLFFRYQVEDQIDALHSPVAQLRSGGYLVINPTEALVSIDVNSGRATRERHIEETALKTNLEAADEIARQLRLRDLAGLVVIDFIDMEDGRNNAAVERRMKEAMRSDRARLQIGRISHFGLMELSRQRLRPSLLETNFEKCPHCVGLGHVRSTESTALSVLRALEHEGIKSRGNDYLVKLASNVALYILNHKRAALASIQQRYGIQAQFEAGTAENPSEFIVERQKPRNRDEDGPIVTAEALMADELIAPRPKRDEEREPREAGRRERSEHRNDRGRDRPRRNNQPRPELGTQAAPAGVEELATDSQSETVEANGSNGEPRFANQDDQRRRRRGRRGGRRRGRGEGESEPGTQGRSEDWNRGNAANGNTQHAVTLEQGVAAQPAPQVPQFTPPPIPSSIFDLDTTPREEPRSASYQPYEVINETSDKPKMGWWRRLTGQ